MPHEPLSVRRGLRAPLGYHPGIPTHVRAPLDEWVNSQLHSSQGYLRTDRIDDLIAELQLPIAEALYRDRLKGIGRRIQADDDDFLDVINYLCGYASTHDLQKLERMLSLGMSVWRVRAGGTPGLEERLSSTTQELVDRALTDSDAASEHLEAAWAAAFGRNPDPTAAWHAAVKAVEVLLQPIVERNNGKATLGTLVRALEAKPSKWTFPIATADGAYTAERFLEALKLVGYEPGRHGTDPSRATDEQARAVVLQAVVIVEWLRGGMLTARE